MKDMTKEEILEFYMQMPWFRRESAKLHFSEEYFVLHKSYEVAKKEGNLLEESDGQFTGGARHELYDFKTGNVLWEFLFVGECLTTWTVYDKAIYYGK